MKCKACGGLGKQPLVLALDGTPLADCPRCHGTGVEPEVEQEKCGHDSQPCRTCASGPEALRCYKRTMDGVWCSHGIERDSYPRSACLYVPTETDRLRSRLSALAAVGEEMAGLVEDISDHPWTIGPEFVARARAVLAKWKAARDA